MDDQTKKYLDNMMGQINGQFDCMLDLLTAMRQESDSTRGHVPCGLQENLTLSQRITKLEEQTRKR
jgi:hypothetical protein